MVRNKLAAAILSAGLALPGLASALGVGDYTLKSYLNQPLELEIELIQTADLTSEEVLAALASQEDFARAGVDRVFFLADISFEIRQVDGKMSVVARSRKPVTEPFLNFLLEVQWPQGRVLREYTILLDPPVYKAGDAATAMAEPVIVAAPEPAPQPAPVVAPAPVQPVAVPAPAVADSSLPPPPSGAAAQPTRQPTPKPAPAAEPAPVAVEGDYRVQSGDTMGQIAARHRGGASLQQTMLAIQRANPDAFIKGNVNLVRKGAVLRIPGEAEIQQVSVAEAKDTIASQNRAWREMIDQRAAALPSDKAQLEAGSAPVAKAPVKKGTGAGEVTLVAPAAAAKGATASSGKEPDAAAKKQIASAQKEVDQAAKDNQALASRVADLDKKVKDSEKTLGVKSDQIAALQTELETLRKAKGAPAPAAPAEQPGAPDAAVAEAAPAEAAPAPAPAKPAPAQAQVDEAPAPKPKGTSMLGPIAGLLALAAAGGAGFWFWRKKKAAQGGAASLDRIEDVGHDEQVADDLAQLQDLNLGHDEEVAEPQAAAHMDGESGDPLGEADMYMAYGRFQQAADILYAALQREPERDDIRVKLAEVYAEMGDTDSAREQAESVSDSHSADVRRQAAAVLARVGGAAAGAAVAADAEDVPSLDDLALEFSGGKQETAADLGDDLNFDLAEEPAAAPVAQAEDDSLEFSLDDFAAPAAAPAASKPAAAGLGELSLEDDGLGEFTLEEEAPATAASAEDFSLEDELALADDIDFSAEADTAVAAEEPLDLSLEEEVVAAEPPAAAPVADLDLESELADLQADLSTEGAAGAGDTGGDDFDFLSDSDENATKLDLAKAYIDMGDAEGARDILNEVVAEGNATQKSEAQKLLAQVG